MKRALLDFFFLFYFGISISQAQSRDFIFTGRLSSISSSIERKSDSIVLFLGRNFTESNFPTAEKIFIPVDTSGQFHAVIKSLSGISWVLFQLPKYTNQVKKGYFYAEPGDSIFLNSIAYPDEVVYLFSGKGAEKFAYKFRIDYMYRMLLKSGTNPAGFGLQATSSKGPLGFLKIFQRERFATYEWQSLFLEQFKPLLSKSIYALYKSEIVSDYRTSLISYMNTEYKNANENVRDSFRDIYSSLAKTNYNRHNDYAAISPEVIKDLRTEISFKLKITGQASGKTNLYNYIYSNYTGRLRENLLYDFLSRGYLAIQDPLEYRLFIEKAVAITKNEVIRRRYLAMLDRKSKGSPIFDYAMTNFDGGKTKLSQFKGKVVLVDYWYTGCVPCASLEKTMSEKVLPNIENLSDVVFVSINGDDKKEKWIKNAEQGVYTPPQAVHLFTDGLVSDHPFIKYYEFYGAPSMMIIGKDGKLFALKPSHDAATILKLLNEALRAE